MTASTQDRRERLAAEIRYLHGCFFANALPDVVVERYVEANLLLLADAEDRERQLLGTVTSRRLDPEAVELALRRSPGQNVMSQKLQILFSLVEVRSDYYHYFNVGDRSQSFALLKLARAALRSGVKLIQGRYLVWRHTLV
jgi:hypothetical protein